MSKARELANLGNAYSDGALSNRNLIINGAMQVAQRGTSVTGVNSSNYYTVDRTKITTGGSPSYAFTVSQSSTAPEGFSNSLKLECTTADASLAADDLMRLDHYIEAQNLQQLAYGTASAKTLTLSFWVRASKTGDYRIWFFQNDATRSNAGSYTISSANTWEYKTVEIAGDVSGVINNDNDRGLLLSFAVLAGTNYTSGTLPTAWQANVTANRFVGQSVNLADTVGNDFYITGVQLEVGDTATPFEHRSYGDELARCQRYFERWDFPVSFDWYVTSTADHSHDVDCPYNGAFAVAKRAAPTYSRSGTFIVSNLSSNDWTARPTTNSVTFFNGSNAAGRYYSYNQTSAHLDFDAEL